MQRSDQGVRYSVGTLTYTKVGLVWLFFWLLWGDFCFTLMEAVVPSIVPLKLKELGAPNWLMAMLLTSIPGILNSVMNPIISTASDRHRGPRGRRIPFMLYATPFIAAALCLVGLSPDIAQWLHRTPLVRATGWSAAAVTVGTMAVTLVFFRFCEMFIGTVFWYFFNDVVPKQFLARFLGLFRMVGCGAGALYNAFVFPHALTHMRLIFLGAGALYFTGFMLMCTRVKEGQYPPPDPYPDGGRMRLLTVITTYLRQCLCHRIYVFFFLTNVFLTLAWVVGVFSVFLSLSLGLTLKQIGMINGAVGVAFTLLTYPAGALADRVHPLRLLLWVSFVQFLYYPINFIWLFTHYSPEVNFRLYIVISVIGLPMGLIYTAVSFPMFMRILPQSHFGQFCSFNALCSASAGIVGGVLAGAFLDRMRRLFPDAVYGQYFCYRFNPVWLVAWLSLNLICLTLLYREWLRLGGEKAYTPPGEVAVSSSGAEHKEKAVCAE